MNRVLAHTGVKYPIVQAPMGWIARAQLASAVSTPAGSASSRPRRGETRRRAAPRSRRCASSPTSRSASTSPHAFVRDPRIVDFVVDQGVKFVTTSAGAPTKLLPAAEGRGPHRLPRRADARRGAEGRRRRRRRAGGRRRRGRRLQEPARRRDAWCCCRWSRRAYRRADDRRRRHLRRPRHGGGVRAGRRGRSRWARAWCQRGRESRCTPTGSTRSSTREETDTVFLNRISQPACGRCAPNAPARDRPRRRLRPARLRQHALDLYFGGDMEASIALSGQTAGRIHEVLPVAEIIAPHGRGFPRHPGVASGTLSARRFLDYCAEPPLAA